MMNFLTLEYLFFQSKAAQENFEKRQQQQTPGLSVNDKVIEGKSYLSNNFFSFWCLIF